MGLFPDMISELPEKLSKCETYIFPKCGPFNLLFLLFLEIPSHFMWQNLDSLHHEELVIHMCQMKQQFVQDFFFFFF